jgi:hypothetical protein
MFIIFKLITNTIAISRVESITCTCITSELNPGLLNVTGFS